jgi:hypothetical protein
MNTMASTSATQPTTICEENIMFSFQTKAEIGSKEVSNVEIDEA